MKKSVSLRLSSLLPPLKNLSVNTEDRSHLRTSQPRLAPPPTPRSSVKHRNLGRIRFQDEVVETAKGYVQGLRPEFHNIHNVRVMTDYLVNNEFRSDNDLERSVDGPN
ncbi:MAG: hypothetical protein ACI9BD_001366 [Candidatus Marinamargulisbacteria bacterium]|jgi:hypothetical protein